jgi:hypothetical protein
MFFLINILELSKLFCNYQYNFLSLKKKEDMTQVGVFVITQVPNNRKEEIDSKMISLFCEIDEYTYAYISSETENETLFLLSEDEVIDKFYKTLSEFGMLVSFHYATKDFLFQKNLPDIFNDEFSEVLSYFLYCNLTKDDVLDKILDMGIESLTYYDYRVLER